MNATTTDLIPRSVRLQSLIEALDRLRDMRPDLGEHVNRAQEDARSLARSMDRLAEEILK